MRVKRNWRAECFWRGARNFCSSRRRLWAENLTEATGAIVIAARSTPFVIAPCRIRLLQAFDRAERRFFVRATKCVRTTPLQALHDVERNCSMECAQALAQKIWRTAEKPLTKNHLRISGPGASTKKSEVKICSICCAAKKTDRRRLGKFLRTRDREK